MGLYVTDSLRPLESKNRCGWAPFKYQRTARECIEENTDLLLSDAINNLRAFSEPTNRRPEFEQHNYVWASSGLIIIVVITCFEGHEIPLAVR